MPVRRLLRFRLPEKARGASMMSDERSGQDRGTPAFARVLGRADLLLFSVSAILTIDTLASAASMGVSWFGWWAVTMVVFFVPYGLITAELGAAWPGEGGLYVWVREAMGPRWGSLAAWFYWINNAYWVPSVYMVFAGTFHSIFLRAHLPPPLQEGPGATWLQAGIALVATWMTVGIGVVRLQVSKWVPNVNAVVKVAIFAVLGVLGALSLLSGHQAANAFAWRAMVPDPDASLRFLPVLVYNALGFELMSSAGEEMRDPQRDVPRVILHSGLLISVVYTLGVAGILISVPVAELSLLTGTWDALAALARPWGGWADALVLALGVGFLYACVANIVTWSLGVNRVAAAAAAEGALPAALGRLHPRYNTPHRAFVIMGVISSLLLVGNAALASNASNVFWMVFKLSGLCFLISYLMVFPAFALLRRQQPDRPRPYRMPGGLTVAWAAALLCWAVIAVACALFFKPSSGVDPAQASRETWLLGGETLATLLVGLWLMPRNRATSNERDTRNNERGTEDTEKSTEGTENSRENGKGRK
jgi:amino acid transporter